MPHHHQFVVHKHAMPVSHHPARHYHNILLSYVAYVIFISVYKCIPSKEKKNIYLDYSSNTAICNPLSLAHDVAHHNQTSTCVVYKKYSTSPLTLVRCLTKEMKYKSFHFPGVLDEDIDRNGLSRGQKSTEVSVSVQQSLHKHAQPWQFHVFRDCKLTDTYYL